MSSQNTQIERSPKTRLPAGLEVPNFLTFTVRQRAADTGKVIPIFELNSPALSLQDDNLNHLLEIARTELAVGRLVAVSAHHPMTDQQIWVVTLTSDAPEVLVVLDGLAKVLTEVMPVIRAATAVAEKASAGALATLEAALQALPTPQTAGWA